MTAYLDAVDAVLTRDPIDYAGPVADAQATLKDIAAIASRAGDKLPALSDDQKSAVEGTLRLLGEVATEAQKVSDLRGIDESALPATLDRLTAVNERWADRMNAQLSTRESLARRALGRLPAASYDARRGQAGMLMTLIERREQLPAVRAALADTVAELRRAHADYRALLFGDSRLFTLKEKRKAAAITRNRLRAVLHNLAAVVTAF